jgi:hypothetical protein
VRIRRIGKRQRDQLKAVYFQSHAVINVSRRFLPFLSLFFKASTLSITHVIASSGHAMPDFGSAL